MVVSFRVLTILLAVLVTGALSSDRLVAHAAEEKVQDKSAQVFEKFSAGEVGAEDARQILFQMSNDDMTAFSTAALEWLRSGESSKVRAATWSLEVLGRRKEFSVANASVILDGLSSSKTEIDPRLEVRLLAKADRLSVSRIQELIQESSKGPGPSAPRLATLGVLTDILSEKGVAPNLLQLETLLKSDVFEIRMHAVDWFRLSPLPSVQERAKFLEQAFSVKPVQARERAYRTLASWQGEEVRAILKASPKLVTRTCEKDKSPSIRAACLEIIEKSKSKTKGEAP